MSIHNNVTVIEINCLLQWYEEIVEDYFLCLTHALLRQNWRLLKPYVFFQIFIMLISNKVSLKDYQWIDWNYIVMSFNGTVHDRQKERPALTWKLYIRKPFHNHFLHCLFSKVFGVIAVNRCIPCHPISYRHNVFCRWEFRKIFKPCRVLLNICIISILSGFSSITCCSLL